MATMRMTGMSTCAFRLVLSALVWAAMLAQDQAPASFKTNTNLVIVNVSVKDKSGKAIEDLKKDQFTLLEDGKPQQIAVFELQRLHGETLPALEAPAPALKTRGPVEVNPPSPEKAPPAEPPPPVKSDQL